MKLKIFGSGGKSPIPGCECNVCSSLNPRDRRNRPLFLLDTGEFTIAINSPPELVDLLDKPPDYIFLPHHHHTHIGGLPDIRFFEKTKLIVPRHLLFQFKSTRHIEGSWGYYFFQLLNNGTEAIYPDKKGEVLIKNSDEPIRLFDSLHGDILTSSLAYKSFVYINDCDMIGPDLHDHLAKNEISLILASTPYLDTAVPYFIGWEDLVQYQAKKVILTHFPHKFKTYAELIQDARTIDDRFDVAYDGLTVEFD